MASSPGNILKLRGLIKERDAKSDDEDADDDTEKTEDAEADEDDDDDETGDEEIELKTRRAVPDPSLWL